MRQPDIEIYLKDASHEQVAQWLEQRLGSLSPWQDKGQGLSSQAGGIPIDWFARAVGKWHSLYLGSDRTPWEDDLACARDAALALAIEVRCSPGSWQEEQGEEDADRWLSVTADQCSEIVWRS